MKTKLFFVFLLFITQFLSAQRPPDAVYVEFNDGKNYTGRLLKLLSDKIEVEFVHTNSIYQFDKTGKILRSTGGYKVGDFVNEISIEPPLANCTNSSLLSEVEIAITFSDGKTFYGALSNPTSNNFSATFIHSFNIYEFQKRGQDWYILKKTGGTYPIGQKINSVWTLDSKSIVKYMGK